MHVNDLPGGKHTPRNSHSILQHGDNDSLPPRPPLTGHDSGVSSMSRAEGEPKDNARKNFLGKVKDLKKKCPTWVWYLLGMGIGAGIYVWTRKRSHNQTGWRRVI